MVAKGVAGLIGRFFWCGGVFVRFMGEKGRMGLVKKKILNLH
jgi:hypothetical protein